MLITIHYSSTEPYILTTMGEQEKKVEDISLMDRATSYGEGLAMKLDDKDNREFYGSSISDSYRLKSELVSKSLEEIGMGRYQWELFVVTGFGWITDNL